MTTVTIQANEAFTYTAYLRPLAAVPGRFNLTISSTFTGASDPAPRVAFQTTLDREGLLALRDLIDSELSSCR